MKTVQVNKSKGYIVFGIFGIIFSATYLGLSFDLSMGTLRKPGPGVFPVMAGLFTLIGSIGAVIEGLRSTSQEKIEFPRGEDLSRLLKIIVSLVLYLILLPIIGQIGSTAIFSYMVMKTLSDAHSNIRLIIYSVAISLITYWMFVVIFK